MTRAELDSLDREALIVRAEQAGVSRARILTRPELVDELLLRSSAAGDKRAARARGFFGRARDLLARVIEQGLHLPDAAERVRTFATVLPAPTRSSAAALPTVTLAEIYAAQGHRGRALDTLRHVLEREPEHAAASTLLRQLEDASYTVPSPPLPPEHDEGEAAMDANDGESNESTDSAEFGAAAAALAFDASAASDTEAPSAYETVDECVAIPLDRETLFVRWDTREVTVASMRAARSEGRLAVRVVAIRPTWDGPESSVRDVDVDAARGDAFVGDLPMGSVMRAALGWRDGDAFVPIAHSPSLEASADALVRWTPAGAVPLAPLDPDARSIAQTVERAREAARA
jgi:hypothetical protein